MSVSAKLTWDVPPDRLVGPLKAFPERLTEAMMKLAEFFAQKVMSYAKANARWTDRTGNARQGLTGKALKTATGVAIVLFHTMRYGIWLEIANQGLYAIILETLEKHYSEVMGAFTNLARGAR